MRHHNTQISKTHFHFGLFTAFGLLLIIGTGCNSGGNDTATPAKPSTTTYTGSVSAPGGAIAQLKSHSVVSRMLAMVFGAELQAAISGMTGVPDATVELIQIDDDGNQVGDVIETATTDSSGKYSLTSSASPSSDLVLRVLTASATVRAFATSSSIDISPVSEYLVEKILTTVASSASITLNNFNNTELDLLMAYLNDLSVFLSPASVAASLSTLDSAASGSGIDSEIGLYSPDGLMLAGTWYVQSITGPNTCGDPVGVVQDSGTFSITQSGDSYVVHMSDLTTDTVRLSGYKVIDIDLSTYPQDGGTVTETAMSLSVEPDGRSINGSLSWSWTDGSVTCTGTDSIMLSKL